MGKHSNRKRAYNSEWQKERQFSGWLTSDPDTKSDRAYCKLCEQTLRAHKTDLLKHKGTTKHVQKEEEINPAKQRRLQYAPVDVSDDRKKRDFLLSLFCCNHTSIRSVDHLGELLNNSVFNPDGSRSDAKLDIRLHRTKCASIIVNVFYPALIEQLRNEIGDAYFSVIVDESTDVSQDKFMAYCIRYYNKVLEKIVTDFLGIQIVERATADILYDSFLQFFSENGINADNMIAIATDGANSLCGSNHSLYSLLKQKFPKLVLLKCINHSLDKCSQYACNDLPSCLEFLVRETRNWFAHSPLRLMVYRNLVQSLGKAKPPKLTSLSGTRWLSFNTATKQTLQQWETLKAHFATVVRDAEQDRAKSCYVARTLCNMYADDVNRLYLLFVNGILEEVNKLNLGFQSNKTDIVSLYNDLHLMILQLARRVFKPSFLKVQNENDLHIIERKAAELDLIKSAVQKSNVAFGCSVLKDEDIDYGYQFEDFLLNQTHNISKNQLPSMKEKCRQFMLKLLEQLMDRVPPNFKTVQKVQYFSPLFCVDQKTKLSHNVLPWDLFPDTWSRDEVIKQWERIQQFKCEDIFGEKKNLMSVDIIEFWNKVKAMKNAVGEYCFAELANFAILALTLPVSNAVVERVFSVMNSIKTKLRNRMGVKMLNSIMFTRLFCFVRNICCNTFIPSPSMYRMHNNSMYLTRNSSTSDDTDAISDVVELWHEATNLEDYMVEEYEYE